MFIFPSNLGAECRHLQLEQSRIQREKESIGEGECEFTIS